MSCSGVPKQMRADASWLWTWNIPRSRVPPYDFIDPESRERLVTSCAKDRAGGRGLALCNQLLKMLDGLAPQGAEAPFIALAVQTHFTGPLEIQVFDAKIDDFLSAGPGVIQEQNESPVTQGKWPLSGHRAQQRGHLLALKIMGIGQRRSFYGDRGDLLAYGEHVRHTDREVREQCGQRRASLVARAGRITSFVLKMCKKSEHRIEREVLECQSCNRPAVVLGEKAQ